MKVQYPKRRETDEEAQLRVNKIAEGNQKQGFDAVGNFLDKTIKKMGRDQLKRLRF